MIYEHFCTNKNLGLVFAISDLSKFVCLGDDKMETFRNNWETTISGMATEIDDANLTEMPLAQMTYSKELKEQVQRFRKWDMDDPKRCYTALVDYI